MTDFLLSFHELIQAPWGLGVRLFHGAFLGVWLVVWLEPFWRLRSSWRAWVFPRGWRSWGAYAAVYPLTMFAAHRLKFFSFSAQPLPEALGATAMVFLCLALLCAGAVSRIWAVSRWRRGIALGVSALSLGLFFVFTQLWGASGAPQGKPLARFAVTPDGRLRVIDASPRFSPLNPTNGRVIVALKKARWVWPEMRADQTMVLNVAGIPTAGWALRRLASGYAQSPWNGRPRWPRVAVEVVSLEVDPPGYFTVYLSEDGLELGLSKAAL